MPGESVLDTGKKYVEAPPACGKQINRAAARGAGWNLRTQPSLPFSSDISLSSPSSSHAVAASPPPRREDGRRVCRVIH
ncbi:hypothetical protein GCM10023074_69530 [Microbispora amethystogenes]